jgi:hypothetical protein
MLMEWRTLRVRFHLDVSNVIQLGFVRMANHLIASMMKEPCSELRAKSVTDPDKSISITIVEILQQQNPLRSLTQVTCLETFQSISVRSAIPVLVKQSSPHSVFGRAIS